MDRSVIRHNQDRSGVEKSFFAIISRSTSPILAIFFVVTRTTSSIQQKKDRRDRITGSRDNVFQVRIESKSSLDWIAKIRSESDLCGTLGLGEEATLRRVYFSTDAFKDPLYPAVVHLGAFTGASSSPTAGWVLSYTRFLVLRAFNCPEHPST